MRERKEDPRLRRLRKMREIERERAREREREIYGKHQASHSVG